MKTRILTALVLLPIILSLIIYGNLLVFGVLIGVFIGLASWEWAQLIPGVKHKGYCIAYTALILGVYVLGVWEFFNSPMNVLHDYLPTVLWLLAITIVLTWVYIFSYPKTVKYWHGKLSVSVLGLFLLAGSAVACLVLRELPHGLGFLISMLCMTWAADTGAYFAGNFWGGTPSFSPKISPKKTWEGFWGGFILTCIVIGISGYSFAANAIGWCPWIALSLLTFFAAVMGDLWVSLLKRCVHKKDTGYLLPGHGGILDRIDSVLMTSIVMTEGLLLLKYFQ